MNSPSTVIIGANGQLGKALVARYPKAIAVDREELDITDPQALSAFDWSQITNILNAAAYTNVDGAETADGRRLAWQINATAPGYLAAIATQHNITIVHVSSEYVFDGTTAPHTETEPFTPLGVYAQSKAAGDIAIATAPNHYILRVSWLIGDGPNFVRTMAGLAGRNLSPKVVNDQIGRLTFTTTLVDAIEHLVNKQAPYGTYNLSNSGEAASWATITKTIFAKLGRTDLTVTGISTKDYFADKPEVAPRPLLSELDLAKITATGFTSAPWNELLLEYVKQL